VEEQFFEWIAEGSKVIETKAVSQVWNEKFEVARNDLDIIGGLIEHAKNQISSIEHTKNSMVVQIVLIDVLL